MSQEINQPTPQETPKNNPQPQQQPKRNNTVAYWVAIIALLIACIFLFVSKRQTSQQMDVTNKQMDSVKTDRESLNNEYKAAIGRLDQLTTKNVEMDSALHGKDGEIAKLRSQIQGILSDSRASASQLAKARELINTLNSKVSGYEERIAALEGENKNLTAQNEVVTKERDSTVAKNMELKKIGSVLHASNMRLTPLHLKHGGTKEKETTKAKRVDVLRVTFDIDENRIAEDGNKNVYLRITGPDGAMLSNAAYGSGATSSSDGSQMNYTIMKEIALKQGQPVKDVTVDWHQDSDYKKGSYTIEIYNEGYRIGSGTVALR